MASSLWRSVRLNCSEPSEFLCHLLQAHHILQAVDHPGICGLAIAAGAAGFLIIGFDAFGQIQMGDKAHIGFIYAHAKGDGGDNNHAVFAQESDSDGSAAVGATGLHGRARR